MEKSKAPLLLCITGSSHQDYFYQLKQSLGLPTLLMRRRGNWQFSWRAWQIKPEKDLRQLVSRMVEVSQVKRNRSYPYFYAAIYRWLRLLEARLLFVRYYCYFVTHPSELVAIWNGNKFYGAAATIAARAAGRRMLFFEGGLLPDTTTMDDKGINDANSLPRDESFYLNWARENRAVVAAELPLTLVRREFDRNKKVIGEEMSLPPRYIFVPFQVNGDSQIFNHSQWIGNMHQFYAILTELVAGMKDRQTMLVIKEHPSCPMEYRDLHLAAAKNGRLMFANLNNTQQLIENAMAVITINSTVGLEALLLDKKVVTLGDACYNLAGLVVHSNNKRELIETINGIDDWQANQELRRAFLSFVYHRYCIPASYRNPDKRHWQAIEKRLTLMARGQDWLSG